MTRTPTERRMLRDIALMAAIGLASGCSPETADEGVSGARADPGRSGSLYLDQTAEFVSSGQNPDRAGYLSIIETCREAGLPVGELSPEEADLVGTTRVQMWIEADSAAYRVEHFLAMPEPGEMPYCSFYLGSRGLHAYFDEERTVEMALDLNETKETSANPRRFVWRRGEGRAGADAQATDRVGGQPCRETQHPAMPGVTYCFWTGGAPWGFADQDLEPFSSSNIDYPFSAGIILRQDPGNTVVPSYRVHTRTLQVGGVLENDMSPRPASAWPAKQPRS